MLHVEDSSCDVEYIFWFRRSTFHPQTHSQWNETSYMHRKLASCNSTPFKLIQLDKTRRKSQHNPLNVLKVDNCMLNVLCLWKPRISKEKCWLMELESQISSTFPSISVELNLKIHHSTNTHSRTTSTILLSSQYCGIRARDFHLSKC